MLLITLIFAGLLICEKVILNKIASISASRSASIINDTGLLELSHEYSLYQRLSNDVTITEYNLDVNRELKKSLEKAFEMKTSNNISDRKQGAIQYEINSRLSGCILKPKTTYVRIEHYESFLKGRITVSLKQEISIPLGFIKEWFDGKDTITLEAEYTSSVVEPSEYIRNMDLVIEYSKKIKEGLNVNEVLEKIKNNKYINNTK
jgi:hypothetical protein